MDINAFEQAEAGRNIAQHISKSIKIDEEHDVLSGEERASLEKLYTRLVNNWLQKKQEMTATSYQECEPLFAQRDGRAKLRWYSDEMRAGKLQPPTLFRFVEGNQAMENHWTGKLWFRSLPYFRNIESVGADPSEGIGSYELPNGRICRNVSDQTPTQPAFILCFGEETAALKTFGENCLKVSRPLELKRRVEAKLCPGSQVEWRKIKCDKVMDKDNEVMQLEANPSPTEGWDRSHYSKPAKYADEKEWRLVIFLPPPIRLLNNTLELHVGKLIDVFRLVDLSMRSD